MSKIDAMLQEMCPDRVERKLLKEVSIMKRGTSATRKTLTDGKIPVISGGKEPAFYCSQSNRNGQTITIAGSGAGAGFVQYWSQPIFVNDAFSVKGMVNTDTKYLYYYLSNMQDRIYATKTGGGIPHVRISNIENFSIPIPPLEIQKEIVKVLDNFTEYSTELQTELQTRIKQYEYYRDKLLSFDNLTSEVGQVEWRTLGELGIFKRGNGIQKKDFVLNGFPCIHYGQLYTYYGIYASKTKTFISESLAKNKTFAQKGDLVIATTSENDNDVCKAVAWVGDDDVAISGDAYVFRHKENPKYMSYFFQSAIFQEQKRRYITGTKVRRVSGDNMAKIKIPLPTLRVQERIANVLDTFNTVCNDIKSGLPAEIAARQKQYEYYRDKLLTFKELKK